MYVYLVFRSRVRLANSKVFAVVISQLFPSWTEEDCEIVRLHERVEVEILAVKEEQRDPSFCPSLDKLQVRFGQISCSNSFIYTN
jgi:hypothetical protein